MRVKTYNSEETIKLGERLGRALKPGACILLRGDLGSGKTTFTKGIGLGIGVKRMINSPTFTIVKEYQGTYRLYHVDMYRTEGYHNDYFLEDFIGGDGITCLEWPDKMPEIWPKEYLLVTFVVISEVERWIEFESSGLQYAKIVGELNG